MSTIKNLQGECQQCGRLIEFHPESAGTSAECPHCGQFTELLLVVPEESSSPGRTKAVVFTILAVVILLGGLIGALVALKRAQRMSARQQEVLANSNAQNPPRPADSFAAAGFQVSDVTLGKGEGSSILYAVGKIRNLSGHQRFGVRVELEILDAATNKIGSAKDYRPVLEASDEWSFRALVVEKQAASARVSSISHDQ